MRPRAGAVVPERGGLQAYLVIVDVKELIDDGLGLPLHVLLRESGSVWALGHHQLFYHCGHHTQVRVTLCAWKQGGRVYVCVRAFGLHWAVEGE